jgi:hypothetical protein
VCGFSFTPSGTPTSSQTANDCKKNECDGNGGVMVVADPADPPAASGPCFSGTCTGTTPGQTPLASGATCSVGSGVECDGAGNCVQCLTGAQCPSSVCSVGVCQTATCSDGVQNEGETGIDCGGPCPICPTVLAVAAGSGATYGGEFHPGGAWATTALGNSSVDPPAVTITSAGLGVGLVHSAAGADLLMYATWSAGTWQTFASVGAGVTTRKGPAIDAATSTAQAVFHGTDFNHYYTSFDGSAWAAVAEVSSGGVISDGPTPAGIAARGGDATLAFFLNAANTPQAQDLTSGAWQAEVALGTDQSFVASPSIVRLNGGSADVMVAFIRASDGAVMFTTRTAGTWAATVAIAGTAAHVDGSFGPVEYVGLAALPSGGAALAYRDGSTGGIFYALYAAGAWSAPAAFSSPNVTPLASPSLAPGVGTATVEIAFVDTDTTAYHARLVSGSWSVPTAIVGSNLSSVSIASAP